MRLFGRKGSSEKLTVKRVKGYVFKDCKLIRTFGLFVTVKDHDTHQIHMADFIDNYSTSRQALDVFIEKLFRLAPYQIQDVMDDAKRERAGPWRLYRAAGGGLFRGISKPLPPPVKGRPLFGRP